MSGTSMANGYAGRSIGAPHRTANISVVSRQHFILLQQTLTVQPIAKI
jgi:hypothetical protein